MRQCLFCSKHYDDAVRFCPHDGQELPPPDNFVGKVVDGKYRIDELYGSGGMGAVYRATQVHLERTVAFKVVRGEFLKDAMVSERFRREALAVARLKHPHIVTVYDFGMIPEGGAYLVMEFLEGHSLRDEIQQHKRIPTGHAIELMRQICSAVHAAHNEGIIHRDLKPDNIILETGRDNSIVAKVLDFGVAKLRQSSTEMPSPDLTTSGMVLGTPIYMSPEQCQGDALDARADIYSLGCVFYEMLTGRPPFLANSAATLIIKHASEMPDPPSKYSSEIPPALEAAIMRSLAKSPDDRFQSSAELGNAIGAVWIPLDPDSSFPPVLARALGEHSGGHLSEEFDGLVQNLGALEIGNDNRRRLAVLPFRNVTRDPAIAYLGFSLADAVISQLSDEKSIVVRPSTAIEQFTETTLDPREMSRLLEVELLVTGTFIKAGEAFQLTAQLVDIPRNEILWQQRVKAKCDDILELQDSISDQIVAGVRLKLGLAEGLAAGAAQVQTPSGIPIPTQVATPMHSGRIATPAPVHDPVALELFEQAHKLGDSQEECRQAIELLERSVALDPEHATVWSALAERAYAAGAERYQGSDFAQTARRAVERALALDPTQLGAVVAVGRVLVEAGKAEEVARLATEHLTQQPGSFAARCSLGYAFRFGGLLDRALRELRFAGQVDPDATVTQIATIYLQKRLYDDALRLLDELNARRPRVVALYLATIARGLAGNAAGAREASVQMARIDANSLFTLLGQVFVGRLEGRNVLPLLGWLEGIHTDDGEVHCWLAQMHAFAGDADGALVRLRLAVKSGYFNAPYMLTDPLLESLRPNGEAQVLIDAAKLRHDRFAKAF